jgi:PAS domain S-box-containing protein
VIDNLAAEGKLNNEEAMELLRVIFIGDKQPGNTRDYLHALHKGETGYIWLMDSKGNQIGSANAWEGLNLFEDVEEPTLHKSIKEEINNKSGWHVCLWKEPSKPAYTEVTAYDYYEPRDLIIGSCANMDEFTAPIKAIGRIALLVALLSGGIGVIASLFVSQGIAKPSIKLSETSSKITKGDLSARVDIKVPINEFRVVGKDINRMVDSLQSNIEELRQALGSYSEVLGKVALGDLSARVDTEKLKEEYKLLGDTLNSIVSILEYDTNELKQGEAELNQTMSLCSDALDKVTQQGDLTARVDVSKLKGKYKQIGGDINLLISGLQVKIEELRKEGEELKEAKVFADSIYNNSTVPCVVTARDWKWIRVNPAFEHLTGYSEKEVLGKYDYQMPFWPKEDRERIQKIAKATKHGDRIKVETHWKRKDGKDLILLLDEIFVPQSLSKEIGFIGYLTDITGLKAK